jgi:hypothetical protein
MRVEILLIYLLILLLPFGQLTKLPVGSSQVNIYGQDVVVVLLLIIFGLRKFITREKIIWPKLTKAIGGFVGFAALSFILSFPYRESRELAVAVLYLLRFVAYAGVYLVTSDIVGRQKKIYDFQPKADPPRAERFKIYDLLIVAIEVAAILGLLQYIFIPDISDLRSFGWDPHYFRVVGTYLDSGFMGMFYVLGLIGVSAKVLKNKTLSKTTKAIDWLAFGLIYIALSLTYARSAYASYLVGIGVVAWFKKTPKFFIAALLVLLLTILLLPRPHGEGTKLERSSTIYSRIINYQQALKISGDNPVWGVGFNNYRYVQRDYGFIDLNNWQETHAGSGATASPLFILATCGVMGLITYSLLILKMIAMAKRGVANYLNLTVLAATISLLTHSLFNNSLFYAWLMLWWWLSLGAAES